MTKVTYNKQKNINFEIRSENAEFDVSIKVLIELKKKLNRTERQKLAEEVDLLQSSLQEEFLNEFTEE